MLRVALTGGVGSGKSAAAAIFRELGAYVSQSDETGRAMMQPGGAATGPIAAHFGPAVLRADGTLDRAVLARLAFEGGRVEELNAIVHPLVIAAQAAWAADVATKDPQAIAIVESALIFETRYNAHGLIGAGNETPWRARFDRIVVVTSPIALRRQRYIVRQAGSMSSEAASSDFDSRSATQWTDERKAAQADFVVVNDGSLDQLRGEIERVYSILRQQSTKGVDQAI
jgi:dephospho-CoA kinase